MYPKLGSRVRASEVMSIWQWCRFLKSRILPPKQVLLLNLDETSIKFYYQPKRGLRLRRSLKRTAMDYFTGRNVSRSQMRKAFTHIAIVADDPEVQKHLPQICIVSARVVSVAQAAEARAVLRKLCTCGDDHPDGSRRRNSVKFCECSQNTCVRRVQTNSPSCFSMRILSTAPPRSFGRLVSSTCGSASSQRGRRTFYNP